MSYREDLANITDVSFDKILKLAKDNVPASKIDSPWIGLAHGAKLLTNDDELCQYLAAYGSVYRKRLYAAFNTIQNPAEYFSKNIAIIDWGCGQGLATMCFFDYMRNLGIEPTVTKIILVEPSSPAINRAYEYLVKYSNSAQIVKLNKYINDLETSEINVSDNTLVLHFFSNILDIETIDLGNLSSLIKDGINAEQLFFCIGSQNTRASRIAEFAKRFDLKDDDLIGEQNGLFSFHSTISMMVFRIKANIPKVIKVVYYHHRRTDYNTALNRIIENMDNVSSLSGKTLQFYKAAVSLERMKSTSISDLFDYPYSLDTANGIKFNIDIQNNKEFEQLFLRNANRELTKWPKHLNVSLCILWENTIYRLMEYVYPFEDLKSIDITSQYVSIDLSMFTVSADVVDKLELPEDVVEVITATLTDRATTLSSLESILQDAIGHTVTLYPQLSLCLTAEAPVLAQINSELKKLAKREDENNLLMTSFLCGNIKDNVAGHVSEDEIINVVEMDDSQRRAITTALNSKVSVITGPPGTGKTQMIVNLLANAMLKGKSVLVASKNNKAVDNIKERFDQVDDFQYLIRFGSRDMISSKLLPTLESMMNSIPNIKYDAKVLEKFISDYNLRCTSISEARKLIGELVRLIDTVPELEQSLRDYTEDRNCIEADYCREIEKLRSTNSDIDAIFSRNGYDWDKILLDVQKHLNILQAKNSGLCKLFFNLFSKRNYAATLLNESLSLPLEIKEQIETESGIKEVSDVHNCKQLIQLCKIKEKYISRIISYRNGISSAVSKYNLFVHENERKTKEAEEQLASITNRIHILEESQDRLHDIIKNAREYISLIGNDLINELIKSHLTSANTRQIISRYKNYLPDNIPWKNEDIAVFVEDACNFIKSFRLNSVTSLSVKNAYPLTNEIFDMLIVDEASQCDVASALPLLYRAKQMVVIGDPLQLKHITSVTSSEEKIIKEHLSLNENPLVRYVDYSLWDYCNDLITSADTNNTLVTLDCHYRCHPQIIGYSNEFFYQRKLGTTLRVCTKNENNGLRDKGIVWIDVRGLQRSETRNVNEAEAEKAIALAVDIAQHYPNVSIGIISPFKHQAEEINARIPVDFSERIISDTVHKFQGDERDVIIYSMVVTDNSPIRKIQWIDQRVPNLVNVAVTRARSTLYVVGNRQYIKEHSRHNFPLGYLIEYTENRTNVTSVKRETVIIDTNVFVNSPDILDRIDSTKQIVISAKVIDELDKLKVTLEDAKKRNVELALRNLNKIFEIRNIRMECADLEYLPIDFSRRNPDNMILSVALKYRNQNPMLLTSDNGLQLKAKGLNINTMSLQSMLND